MISNVTYMLDNTAETFNEKIAFKDEKKSVTFGTLQKNAKAIATCIIKEGVVKEPIVVFLEKSVDVIIAFMGIAYSCNFYSPIDIGMPASRVNKILEILNPKIVITTRSGKDIFESYDYKGKFLIYEDIIGIRLDEQKIDAVRKKGIDTDLLYVLFTSGSTGVPKGVTINHRSVIDYIDWVTRTFSISEKDTFGNQAPFYFDNSILDIYTSIKTGATVNIIPQNLFSKPIQLLNYIREEKINNIFWVPSALIDVANQKALEKVDLSDTLERVLFCGEVMHNKQLNEWRKWLPNVIYANLYGPTEITDACTYYIIDREFKDDEPLPIGVPMSNTEIIVLNEDNNLVSVDEVGELCVRGTSLSMGYYNNPEKTKEAFVQNPLNQHVPELIYRTGDLVKYNEYGEIIYISRKDFQIKHMGHRIELGEIETAISSIEEIEINCCLYDDIKKMIICIYVGNVEKSVIRKHLKDIIPRYMIPHKYININSMPLNANGKIDRIELKNRFLDKNDRRK